MLKTTISRGLSAATARAGELAGTTAHPSNIPTKQRRKRNRSIIGGSLGEDKLVPPLYFAPHAAASGSFTGRGNLEAQQFANFGLHVVRRLFGRAEAN